ncbi:MAG: hypothetical protein HN712_00910 [Gemmatimonadetes bacterium]|jgi:hypothetical protein|nr:hypothetical protein [Gemmatimonadota bacterium]
MHDSIERVRAVLRGDTPDRAPLYELFRNDAVINHFTGERLTVENGVELVYRAYEPAVDATRPSVRAPGREERVTLSDGREQRHFRWTIWTQHHTYVDAADYKRQKQQWLRDFDPAWTPDQQAALSRTLASHQSSREKLGEVFFFPGGPAPGLMGIIGEIGLEAFSYYLTDVPGIMAELLEMNTCKAVAWIDHLPEGHGIEAVFCGDDIAFNTGPLLSPTWFDTHYMSRLGRVCDAYHRQGIRVLFHSDGNLLPLMDGLVAAGIDGLNPLEVLAGMCPTIVHERYPHLFLAGGIDVSQLLPFGEPAQIRDVVRRSIDRCEGRLMVGSSTELNDAVPLVNYLALRNAVLEG